MGMRGKGRFVFRGIRSSERKRWERRGKEKDSWSVRVHAAHEVHYPRLSWDDKSTLLKNQYTVNIQNLSRVYGGVGGKERTHKPGAKAAVLHLRMSRCARQPFSLRASARALEQTCVITTSLLETFCFTWPASVSSAYLSMFGTIQNKTSCVNYHNAVD